MILTPHIGGSTEEAQEDIGRFVSAKLRAYAERGSTTLSVNLPTLTPAESTHAQRIAHLHRNAPGVLAHLNQVLALHDVNIGGQTRKSSSIGGGWWARIVRAATGPRVTRRPLTTDSGRAATTS